MLFEKPFALLIGPQRSGTTWVDRYLRSRGDICLPEAVKEIFFFDRHFDRGLDYYRGHFAPKPDHKMIMEITATSFDHSDAPQRIYDSCGDNIRLVCPLRHPIIRSYSLYLHYLRYGIVTGTLQEAIEQEPQIITSSFYADHLRGWFDQFGQDKVHIIFQEDLEHNQEKFIHSLCDALGIEYQAANPEVQGKYNVTTFSNFGFVAAFSQRVADGLRACNLYQVINFAKAIGLKQLIFGKERPDTQKNNIPPEDFQFLLEKLEGQIEALERLIGHKVERWHTITNDHRSDITPS